MEKSQKNAFQQQPPAKKRYTELTGYIYQHPKYINGTIQLPNIWIDPRDLETILQFCQLWSLNYFILLDQVKKLDRVRMNDYCSLLNHCAEACAGLSKYQRQYKMLLQYSRQLELDYTRRYIKCLNGKQRKITQRQLSSQFQSHEQKLEHYKIKNTSKKSKDIFSIFKNLIQNICQKQQVNIQKRKPRMERIRYEGSRQEEDSLIQNMDQNQPS